MRREKLMVKIEQEIVDVAVREQENVSDEEQYVFEAPMDRPPALDGTVYKIKPPNQDEALYVTITNQEVNGQLRPFEIFVISKNMASFQWMSILTRMISALMRQPHTEFPTFLIDEMLSTFDPNGGYFGKSWGPRARSTMYPSVVAEIGHVLKHHCAELGLLEPTAISEDVGSASAPDHKDGQTEQKADSSAPKMGLCTKCHERAVRNMDGCMTCMACGDSKCQ